jgi:hypothetical protein
MAGFSRRYLSHPGTGRGINPRPGSGSGNLDGKVQPQLGWEGTPRGKRCNWWQTFLRQPDGQNGKRRVEANWPALEASGALLMIGVDA